jgi:AraC-like DNA-binding protein
MELPPFNQKMKVKIFQPSDRLKSIISSFTVVETTAIMETTVLPHLGLVLAVQLSGDVFFKRKNEAISIAPVTISGQRNTYRTFLYYPNTTTILVSFTETGAYTIFGEAVFKLYETAEPLENLVVSTEIIELREKLYVANQNQECISIIENFLLNQITAAKTDKLVLVAIDKIKEGKGLCRIAELSSGLGISQDAFEKRFRKMVGSTPKQFSNVVRLKEVIKHQTNHRLLTDLVYTFDFYDQSHFIKQFKDFAGQTPKGCITNFRSKLLR